MSGPFHLTLVGIPQLRDAHGAEVRFRTRKQFAVFIYLALQGPRRPVSREMLIDLLWPDVPNQRGRHSLSQALTALRNTLGRDSVQSNRTGLRLLSAITTDVDSNFEVPPGNGTACLIQGLEDWGGTFWSHWVESARADLLNELNSRLTSELYRARACGNINAVHERAAALYKINPLCSLAALTLAEKHLLEGDGATATKLLQEYTDRASAELGMDPEPAIQRLLLRIKTTSSSLGITKSRSGWGSEASDPARIVGREALILRLEAARQRAHNGELVSCLLVGTGGIGKTSLLRTFASAVAARGWPALLYECQEAGRNIPFATVAGLIHELVKDPAVSATEPFWLAEASRVAPGIRAKYPGIPTPEPTSQDILRLRVMEALVRMIESVTEGGPCLLALDDIGYVDRLSRDILRLLLNHLKGTPSLLIATVAGNAFADSARWNGRHAKLHDWTDIVSVPGLADSDARKLIGSLTEDRQDEPALGKIVELARGNPYLIKALVHDVVENGKSSLAVDAANSSVALQRRRPPHNVRSVLDRQSYGLSTDALHTMRTLAVARRLMGTEDMARIQAVSVQRMQQIVVQLLENDVVQLSEDGITYTSQLHRAHVYHSMSSETRRYHHKRFAEYLVQGEGNHDYQSLLEAGKHYFRADLVNEAVAATRRGSEMAIDQGAPAAARAALEVLTPVQRDKAEVKLLLARALSTEGRYKESVAILTRQPMRLRDKRDAGWAELTSAQALQRGRLANDAQLERIANRALKKAEALADDRLIMEAVQTCSEVASDLGDWQFLVALRQKAAAIAENSRCEKTRALALMNQGYSSLITGHGSLAVAKFNDCLSLLDGTARSADVQKALNGLGVAYAFIGDLIAGLAAFERAANLGHEIGDISATATACSNIGNTHADLGRMGAAERWLERALELASEATSPRQGAQIHLNVANVSMTTGDLNGAVEHIEAARAYARASRFWKLEADVALFDADREIIEGNPERAFALLEQVDRMAKGRRSSVISVEKLERLRRHRSWARHRSEHPKPPPYRAAPGLQRLPLVKQLEIRAFEAWMRSKNGSARTDLENVLAEVHARGLCGVSAYLENLGVK